MIVPTVHLNGTSKAELSAQLEAAVNAVRDALEALSRAAPNARDYYPQNEEAFFGATREHASRLSRLLTVKDELAAIWGAVEEQPGGRP